MRISSNERELFSKGWLAHRKFYDETVYSKKRLHANQLKL